MHIEKLQIRKSRGERIDALSLKVDCENGIKGSTPPKTPERQISLMAGEILPHIRDMGGHCTARFEADIVTAALDYSAISVGSRLLSGSAVIEITAVGKRCFDDCPIRQRGERCPLPDNCAFARIAQEGEISVGDAVEIL